jgi:hypothetical protein
MVRRLTSPPYLASRVRDHPPYNCALAHLILTLNLAQGGAVTDSFAAALFWRALVYTPFDVLGRVLGLFAAGVIVPPDGR